MTSGGYACSRCGAWVFEPQTHSCVTNIPLVTQYPVVWTREDVDTIIRLLEEIEYHVRTRR